MPYCFDAESRTAYMLKGALLSESQVTSVLKEVDLLQAQTDARVAKINAEGARVAAVLQSNANAEALLLEQAAKAKMYAKMRSHLNWSQPQFLEYIKMNALNMQKPANVKLGVDAVGGLKGVS